MTEPKPSGGEVIKGLFARAKPYTPPAAEGEEARGAEAEARSREKAGERKPEAWEDGPPPGFDDVPPPEEPQDGPATQGRAREKAGAQSGRAGGAQTGGPQTGGGGRKGTRLLGLQPLPDDCPVVPLGVKDKIYFYLNCNGQLVDIHFREHNKNAMRHLFAPDLAFLYRHWPRFGKGRAGEPPPIIGWDGEACCETMIAECGEKGLWDPFNKARGAGAWLGEDGELVLHCGDRLLVIHPDQPGPNGVHVDEERPGPWGEHVFPAAPPLRRPPMPFDAKPGPAGPAGEILALLKSWHWKRPDIDPYLALGWIACAYLGGALKWRPLMWVTGDAGTGKSTLQEFFGGLLRDRLLQSSDASAAGVWQTLNISSNAVAIDEGEPEEAGDRRMQAMIKFARQAASGGLILRGGADHVGSAFKARSCFLFSSILVPRLQAQDRSRFIVLELKPLKDKVGRVEKFGVPLDDMKRLGDGILARIAMNWWRWGETLATYRRALVNKGLTERAADLWGTDLAAADVLLFDIFGLEERAAGWGDKIVAQKLHHFGSEVEADAFFECLDEILSHVPEYLRGGVKVRVDSLIREVFAAKTLPDGSLNAEEMGQAEKAERALANCGLRVTFGLKNMPVAALAVASSGQGIAKVFNGTKWAGGVWVQSLARNTKARRGKVRIGGGSPRPCVLLPIAEIIDDTQTDEADA